MELDLSSVDEKNNSKKHLFNLKTHRNDGLILQVHHSYTDSGGVVKRYRFILISFNDSGTRLATADYKGHVFIIDLEAEKYWELPYVGVPTIVSFPVLKKQELLIGLGTNNIIFIHIDTGEIIGSLSGHTMPPTEVSYSDCGYYILTSCTSEAIVWDSQTHNQIHRLSLKPDTFLKKVLFMPVRNHIIACFQDDTINVWKFGSFECIKQIVPETWKTHHLKAIALTKDGRAMVIGGYTSNLVIFCLDTWVIMKIVEFPEYISGIKQMEFLPQVFDGGANKILIMLTSSLEIFFFDIETSNFLKGMHQIFGMAVKFSVSSNGKYLASILTTGEINIYVTEKVLSSRKQLIELENYVNCSAPAKTSSNYVTSRNYSNCSRKTQKSFESLSSIQKQIKDMLDVKKLLPILTQFGEYPESYRILIWKTVLQIPGNQESYVCLSLKKCHPSYVKLELKYPLVNTSLCNSLKKLLSNLSYWCPLFGEVDFFPEFAFPFVKLFHSDPLTCFEVVATIIINWFQNWFEFYPFPPINMLSTMENVLGYHDPSLLEFYLKSNVTSSVFVCPLFHTAFSEVFSKDEWLKLWDHIISNEPSFLFMAIIAYNVVCQNAIKSFSNASDVEKFFHRQNPIDMKMLISKTYRFVKETPEDIHPRQLFSPFTPLDTGGTYTSFVSYPKLIVDSSAEKLQSIRKEEIEILEEQLKTMNLQKKLDKKLKELKGEEQKKIYIELEEKIRNMVDKEEDRILAQRKKLQNLRQELRLKELEVLENTRDKILKERLEKKQLEFERLLQDISKKKAREKMDVDAIEEEVRKYYSELLLRKCQLELDLGLKDGSDDITKELDVQRQRLHSDMIELQNEWSTAHHNKRIDFSNKLGTIKALILELEAEVAKEISKKTSESQSKANKAFIGDLKERVNGLEKEVEQLLIQNLNHLKRKKEKKTVVLYPPPESIISSLGEFDDINQNKPPLTQNHSGNTAKTESKTVNYDDASFKTVKTVSKTISPGVRKITTIRAKFPKPKSQDLVRIKPHEPRDSRRVRMTTDPQKHLKSKFTYTKDRNSNFDFPKTDNNESCASNDSELEIGEKRFHQQPTGDFTKQEMLQTSHRKTSKEKISESVFVEEVSSDTSENEYEIIKSALRARKQLLEEAKLRQSIQ